MSKTVRVKLTRANRDDVWSKGYLCPKGTTLGHLHTDPDRLRVPLVRNAAGEHKEASWDEAFARAEELMSGVIAKHGKEAVNDLHRQPGSSQLFDQPLHRPDDGTRRLAWSDLFGGHR